MRAEGIQNRVTNPSALIRAWDAHQARGLSSGSKPNRRSDMGHLNLEGRATCQEAIIVSYSDSKFWNYIEVGVTKLVKLLVVDCGLVTYTSCEGHPPTAESPLFERHVGILPRDDVELREATNLLISGADAARKHMVCSYVELIIHTGSIESNGRDFPSLDIIFAARTSDWRSYSECLQKCYLMLLKTLGERAAGRG